MLSTTELKIALLSKALGKPEKGTIEIAAAHRGNQTVILIKDDGGGIDLDKIQARMMQMGLDEEDLAVANKSDLLDLIFEPGFSTTRSSDGFVRKRGRDGCGSHQSTKSEGQD